MARLAESMLDGGGTSKKPASSEVTRTPSASTKASIAADKLEATKAQIEAAKAVELAKKNAADLATQLGAKVDPKTGKIDVTTISRTLPGGLVTSGSGNTGGGGATRKVVSNYTDPTTGDVVNVYDDGSEVVVRKGTKVADAARAKAEADAAARANRQSAYDLLFQQFDAYGLSGLVKDLKGLIETGVSPSEFTIRLRESDAYQKRFAANKARVAKGLRALSEAEYIGVEDQYQDVMRRYGLPASFYEQTVDPVTGIKTQAGFEKFISGDVSPVELEDRIQTGQRRVLNAPKEVKDALTQFYGSEISNGDILAYVLDPEKAIETIKRKVTAAEIGAGAMQAGLGTSAARAEELQRLGITGEAARQGYQAIGGFLPRASQLGDIYAKQGMGPFTQTTAEAEVFGTPGSVEATQKRRKLSELEQAQFGGTSGIAQGALSRERAGQF